MHSCGLPQTVVLIGNMNLSEKAKKDLFSRKKKMLNESLASDPGENMSRERRVIIVPELLPPSGSFIKKSKLAILKEGASSRSWRLYSEKKTNEHCS